MQPTAATCSRNSLKEKQNEASCDQNLGPQGPISPACPCPSRGSPTLSAHSTRPHFRFPWPLIPALKMLQQGHSPTPQILAQPWAPPSQAHSQAHVLAWPQPLRDAQSWGCQCSPTAAPGWGGRTGAGCQTLPCHSRSHCHSQPHSAPTSPWQSLVLFR